MNELIKILLESNSLILAFILICSGILVKLIIVIWKVIKENKALDVMSKDTEVTEISIDDKGSVLIKRNDSGIMRSETNENNLPESI
jgi:hypothetical protein